MAPLAAFLHWKMELGRLVKAQQELVSAFIGI